MNENNAEVPLPEPPRAENPVPDQPVPAQPVAPAPVKPKRKIPVLVWIAGCAGILFVCAVIAVAAVYFGLPLFGGDPIISAVPNDSMVYMGVDLTQTQSEKFADIVKIIQGMAEEDTGKNLADSLDKTMKDELEMSFTDDVVPWLGAHGAFVITEADFSGSDATMMFILETRNKNKADEFLTKFVAALEKKQDAEFEQTETDGITFYIDKAESTYDDDTVLARNGKLLYIANSQDAILKSVKLQKADSLASFQAYKDALAVLPKDRLATIYMSSTTISEALDSLYSEAGPFGANPYVTDMAAEGMSGMAMSLSVVDQGLQMDMAAMYDETKMTEYQKQVLATDYLAPTTDALVPEDTFLFVAARTSQTASSYTEVDNPLYSSDMQESLDLLEQQYGIDLKEMVNLIGNEFAFAIGPANDGLFSEAADINIGFTMLAGTTDEAAFKAWFDNTLDTLFTQNMGTPPDTSDTKIGEYELQVLNLPNGSETVPAFIYGVDNGFFVLGTSQSMLENGFGGTKTLANNAAYRQTWTAFPQGSVPYMYLNLKDLMNFLADASSGDRDILDIQKKTEKIPVVAMTVNNATGNINSTTIIFFIEKSEQR